MAPRRGAPILGDSDDSDSFVSDSDVSDAEDALLRRRVRERFANPRAFADDAAGEVEVEVRAPPAPAPDAPPGRSAAPDAAAAAPPSPALSEDERVVLCGDASAPSGGPGARGPVLGVNAGSVGPELAKLRAAQGEHAEHYTIEHYDRLYGWRRPWGRDHRPGKVWCKDIHGPGCVECTSCHFCRQKTADRKTRCVCGEWRRAPPGGRGRGNWCGHCLEMRMGENIAEALEDPEWRCPVCRDICNCSGANCLRAKRDLFPTQQLTHEALAFGWQSVAHYLIATRILSDARAPPILDLPAAQREQYRRRRQRAGLEGGGLGGGGIRGGNGGGIISEEARVRRREREEAEARRRRARAIKTDVARRLRIALMGRAEGGGPSGSGSGAGDGRDRAFVGAAFETAEGEGLMDVDGNDGGGSAANGANGGDGANLASSGSSGSDLDSTSGGEEEEEEEEEEGGGGESEGEGEASGAREGFGAAARAAAAGGGTFEWRRRPDVPSGDCRR